MDALRKLPIVMVGNTTCAYCHEAVAALALAAAPIGGEAAVATVWLDVEPTGHALWDALKQKLGQRTVPYVFVGGQFLGGCDATVAAAADGSLSAKVGQAAAHHGLALAFPFGTAPSGEPLKDQDDSGKSQKGFSHLASERVAETVINLLQRAPSHRTPIEQVGGCSVVPAAALATAPAPPALRLRRMPCWRAGCPEVHARDCSGHAPLDAAAAGHCGEAAGLAAHPRRGFHRPLRAPGAGRRRAAHAAPALLVPRGGGLARRALQRRPGERWLRSAAQQGTWGMEASAGAAARHAWAQAVTARTHAPTRPPVLPMAPQMVAICIVAIVCRTAAWTKWMVLGLAVDCALRLAFGAGPSPLGQLSRCAVARLRPHYCAGVPKQFAAGCATFMASLATLFFFLDGFDPQEIIPSCVLAAFACLASLEAVFDYCLVRERRGLVSRVGAG